MSTGDRSTFIKRQASVCRFVLVAALREALFNVTAAGQCALCSKLLSGATAGCMSSTDAKSSRCWTSKRSSSR